MDCHIVSYPLRRSASGFSTIEHGPHRIHGATSALKKFRHEPFKSRVLLHIFRVFQAECEDVRSVGLHCRTHAAYTAQRGQHIRRYGLYSSRIKGRWPEMAYVVDRTPSGWKAGASGIENGQKVLLNGAGGGVADIHSCCNTRRVSGCQRSIIMNDVKQQAQRNFCSH